MQTDPTFTGVGMMEYGYYLKKFSGDDACKNITIKNCTITLNKAAIYSFGIGVTNISGTTNATVTSTGGRSENVKIYGNTFSNAYGAVLLRGFAHTTAPYEFFDNGNEVGAPSNGNTISDFAGGTSIAYAVYGIYQDSVSVKNNTITGGSGGTGTVYGVFFGAGINTDVTIDGNNISLTNEGTTSQVACISLQTGATTGTTNTQSVTNNTLSVNRTGTTTGTIYFIYTTSTYPLNLHIENNNMGNSSSPGTGAVYGIYQISNPVNLRIRNNIIRNIASNSGSLYGINLSSVTTAQNTEISGNLIDSLVTGGASGTATGINVQTGIAYRIFNNTIRNIATTGTTTTASAFGITRLGTSDSTFIYNNYISDIRAENSIANNAVAGINVTATTTTSYIGLFYNTIFLNAASTSATNFGTSGIFMNTGPISDLRNNVVVNLSTPGPTGGGTVAYRRSSATLTSYAAESNNNDFYVNTAAGERRYFYGEGTLAGVTNADSTLAAFKARVAPRDANSIGENPPFINAATTPYNLHINPAVPTQLESGGTPVTAPIAITQDFDGNLRNATSPDIGADEFAGIGADLTPPSIIYTPVGDVSAGTVQVLTAAISDLSGVPTTGIGRPVLYWKINSGGTYTGATGTYVSGNDFTFSFGAGTVSGDTVYYYIAAQDSLNNVGVFPSVGAGGFTTNPPAASIPPTNPSSYRALGTIAGGTYTVGTATGTYSSLKAAFDAINGAVLTGNVTLSILNEGTTEPASAELDPVRYGAGGPFTVTIKPASGASPTVSGDIAGFLMKFNGADNIMIDGSNSGGTSKNLTLANISQSTNSGIIWLASLGTNAGAENITIKNSKLVAGRNDTTNVMGVYAAGQTITSTGTGAHNNNLVVENNTFERMRFAVYTRGVATTGIQTGLIVRNNIIGSDVPGYEVSYRGIEIGNTDSAMVAGNTIFNIIQSTNLAVTGIHLDVNVSNATIAGNTIRKLHSMFAGTAAGAVGINFNTATGSTNNLVANNMISDLRSNGGGTSTLSNPYGIRIAGGTNHKIYYNSVSLTGSFFGTGTTNLSSAFIVTVSTATGLDMRNNIFSNSLTGEGASKAYAIYAVSTATTFGTIDYNDYFVSGPNGVLARQGTTDVPDLTGWRTFTGQDLNSVNGDPFFVNAASDLHIDPSQPSVVSNAGTPIAAITVDIDGDTRNATTPDIGADEYTPALPGVVLFEDFESRVFPPAGWSTYIAAGDSGWRSSTVAPFSPVTHAFNRYQPAGTMGSKFLVTKRLNIPSAANTYEITFWARRVFTSPFPPDTVYVKLSTTDSLPASFGPAIYKCYTGLLADTATDPNIYGLNYRKFKATFTGIAGPLFVAFDHQDNDGQTIYLDDVTVQEAGPTTPVHDIGVEAVASASLRPSNASGPSSLESARGTVNEKELDEVALESMRKSIEIVPVPESFNSNNAVSFRAFIRNYGQFVENSYQVGWTIDGAAQTAVTNTRPLEIGGRDTLNLTWATPTPGQHVLRAFTILATDTIRTNDTATFNFSVAPPDVVFEEGFNNPIPPYPTGWHVKNLDGGGTTTWFQGNPAVFPAFEGSGYIGANYNAANGFYIDEWLVTPNTGGLGEMENVDSLIFWQRSPSGQVPPNFWPDSIQIRVSTTDTAAASFTLVLDYFQVDTIGWRRKAYALPNAANRYIAFRYLIYNGGVSGSNSNYLGIDAVQIKRTTGPGFFDDFESYTVGQQLVVQNPVDWSTWSGPAGTAEDPFISSAQAFSGTKSVVIVTNNDLVKRLGNDTSGVHEISFRFFVPNGKAGYFNTLNTWPATANAHWAMEVYFDSTGNGRLFGGSATAFPFTYTRNTWQEAKVVVNLTIDSARFVLNGNTISTWRWTAGIGLAGAKRLAANDFFGATAWDQMYMDDYRYRLGSWTGVEEQPEQGIPETFALMQNYPNPFNPTTTIQYALPTASTVSLKIYNILGQEVATLVDQVQTAGYHTAMWNGRNQYGSQVATGVYFYRIEAKGADGAAPFTNLKKMLLVK
ncbi:T9SS type A sorting domain-containing protein [Sphingobacteriales bacterium CHB3]|nr:T9SS type A sorting domain-containing protein [Sphingobacteriales bacterium CHB3]